MSYIFLFSAEIGCPSMSANTDADTDITNCETADMDADTDMKNFRIADTDADMISSKIADTDMRRTNRGHACLPISGGP